MVKTLSVLVVAILCSVSAAQAQSISVGLAFGWLSPYVDGLLNLIITAAFAWAAWYLKSKWNIELDLGHRDALKSFVQRQAQSLVADGFVRLNGVEVKVASQTLANVAATASTAIPDALKHFGLTPDRVASMIEDALPAVPSVAAAQAIAVDVANPATPSTVIVPAQPGLPGV